MNLGLSIVAKAGASQGQESRLVELLSHPKHALQAAKALAKLKNAQALDVLIEKGLKKMGSYSDIMVEGEFFQPFGEVAEARLLPLLDYPNSSTQAAV